MRKQVSEQVKGLFTLFLARDMADKGGLGLVEGPEHVFQGYARKRIILRKRWMKNYERANGRYNGRMKRC